MFCIFYSLTDFTCHYLFTINIYFLYIYVLFSFIYCPVLCDILAVLILCCIITHSLHHLQYKKDVNYKGRNFKNKKFLSYRIPINSVVMKLFRHVQNTEPATDGAVSTLEKIHLLCLYFLHVLL